MLNVYDLACNGLRDAQGVMPPLLLSWRLGSSVQGTRQVSYRVVATSVTDGEQRWDSGTVASAQNVVAYEGDLPLPDETYVWFVTVCDNHGEEATSVPSAFTAGERDGCDGACVPWSPEGWQRLGFVWTSDEELDVELDEASARGDLEDGLWKRVVGLSWADRQAERVLIAPLLDHAPSCDLSFAQAAVLLPRGLLLVRWERVQSAVHLRVSLPPGMSATLQLGADSRDLDSGDHEFDLLA